MNSKFRPLEQVTMTLEQGLQTMSYLRLIRKLLINGGQILKCADCAGTGFKIESSSSTNLSGSREPCKTCEGLGVSYFEHKQP